jgi:3-oxoacyl-[acyl-carrier-protein] synthase II
VLAEGAGMLVLERVEHADGRGAAGYADVAGWGATTDAHHPTTPRPDGSGAAECMRRALASAGVDPAAIGYVNAHGTSTKLGDIAETAALATVFGGGSGTAGPPVSSTKALTGHMLGTSGVVEAAASALAVARGVLPPTYNLDEVDPDCPADHIRTTPLTAKPDYALSNSFGFGGQNVSLVLGQASTTTKREREDR